MIIEILRRLTFAPRAMLKQPDRWMLRIVSALKTFRLGEVEYENEVSLQSAGVALIRIIVCSASGVDGLRIH